MISESYKRSNNHFFYLIKDNHKWKNYKIDIPTIRNWEKHTDTIDSQEAYSHYILFYLQNYDFEANILPQKNQTTF